jgi:hypothetical protein
MGQSVDRGSPWWPSDGEVASGQVEDNNGSDDGSMGLDFGPEMNYGVHGTRWCGR